MRRITVRPIVGALALLALLWASASAVAAAPAAQAVTPSIKASDQPILNNSVVASEVITDVDSWVAVHAFDVEGKLIVNQVVGTAPVKAGTTRDVAVTLNESFNPGDALVLMLHVDGEPHGTFDFPGGADAATTLNNQVVLTQIRVLGDSPATMPDTGDLSRSIMLIGLAALLILVNGYALRRRSRLAPRSVKD